MAPDEILKYCLENLDGTTLVSSWGEKGIFYNPDRVYILTVKESYSETARYYAIKGIYGRLHAQQQSFSERKGPENDRDFKEKSA